MGGVLEGLCILSWETSSASSVLSLPQLLRPRHLLSQWFPPCLHPIISWWPDNLITEATAVWSNNNKIRYKLASSQLLCEEIGFCVWIPSVKAGVIFLSCFTPTSAWTSDPLPPVSYSGSDTSLPLHCHSHWLQSRLAAVSPVRYST